MYHVQGLVVVVVLKRVTTTVVTLSMVFLVEAALVPLRYLVRQQVVELEQTETVFQQAAESPEREVQGFLAASLEQTQLMAVVVAAVSVTRVRLAPAAQGAQGAVETVGSLPQELMAGVI